MTTFWILQVIIHFKDDKLTEHSAVDHVEDTPGGAYNNLDTHFQTTHVLTEVGASNACMAGNIHVVTQGQHHLLDL